MNLMVKTKTEHDVASICNQQVNEKNESRKSPGSRETGMMLEPCVEIGNTRKRRSG